MATITLTPETLSQTVQETDALIIDFWAPWCGPCLRFGPIFEAVSEQHPDVVFAKLDTEAHPEVGAALQVSSIPTLMALRRGVLVFRQAGAMNQSMLTDLVTQLKALDVDELLKEAEAEQAENEEADRPSAQG